MARTMRLSPALALFFLALLAATATAAPPSLTGILAKAGQYTRLLQLLNETQVGISIQNQLNNTYDGITVFAPTDNAFANLKPGTLNDLTQETKVELLNFHVVPKFYTFDTFQTASNPLRTNSPSTLNVTALGSQQFNLSTGVNTVTVTNAINITSPLAVYSLDAVLLPYNLFGANRTAPAPPPAAPGPGKADGGKTTNATAAQPSANSAAARAPGLVTAAALLLGTALFS
ncbi:fasciclin-like arabinogalactan protein 11 [Wolffia australiana]